MAFILEKSTDMYRKGEKQPWSVRLLVDEGRRFVSLSGPHDTHSVVILEMMLESDYDNVVELLRLAVEPEKTETWNQTEFNYEGGKDGQGNINAAE